MKRKILSVAFVNAALLLAGPLEVEAKDQEVEIKYIGDYKGQRAKPGLYSIKKGIDMERQPLGYVVDAGQSITVTNNGVKPITINFFNQYNADTMRWGDDFIIKVGETKTYTNDRNNPLVPVILTPINAEDPDGTFTVTVADSEKFDTIARYSIGNMTGESKYKTEESVFSILNDDGDVYATFKFDNNSIIYTKNDGVSDTGVDYNLTLRDMHYSQISTFNKNTASKTVETNDQQLVQLSQTEFSSHVRFSDATLNDLAVENNKTMAVRLRNNLTFDDGFEFKKGVNYTLEDSNNKDIGTVSIVKNTVNVDLKGGSSNDYVEILDKDDKVLKKVSGTGIISDFELVDGAKVHTHVGNVKHIKKSEGYYPGKDYARYNFQKGDFTMTLDNEFIDVVDLDEAQFREELVGKKFAFIEFEGISFLSSDVDYFINRKYKFHSIKDTAQYYGDYLEFGDAANGIPKENYIDPKFFVREERDTGVNLMYWANQYLSAYATSWYFQNTWGMMHEIGHSYQINVNDFYEGEVTVNFTPATYGAIVNYGYEPGGNTDSQAFSTAVEGYLAGTTYASADGGTQNRSLIFIFQRYGIETLSNVHSSFMQNILLRNTSDTTKDYYVRKISEQAELNFQSYWDLMKIPTTEATKNSLFKYDLVMPLSSVVPLDVAKDNFEQIGLPYYSAFASQDEIDKLNLNGKTTINFDERLIGSKYYVYDNDFKVIKSEEITSTSMIIDDLPVSYYYLSTDYEENDSYTAKTYFLNSARQELEYSISVIDSPEYFAIKAGGLGNGVFAELHATGNQLVWWYNNGMKPHTYFSGREYFGFEVKRGDEVLSSRSFIGDQAYTYADNHETITLQEGDILTLRHQEGWRLNTYIAGQAANTYGQVNNMQYIFTNGSLKPIINGEPNNDQYYDIHEASYSNLVESNPEMAEIFGWYSREKVPTNNTKVNITLDASADGSFVYAYDTSGNQVDKAEVKAGKATLSVPRGTYSFTSDYLDDSYYYVAEDYKVNPTTNTNITLEKENVFENKYEYNLVYNESDLQLSVDKEKIILTAADSSLLEGLTIDVKDVDGNIVKTYTVEDFIDNKLEITLAAGQSFILNSNEMLTSATLKNTISGDEIKVNDLVNPISLRNNGGQIEQLNSLHRQLYINSLGKYYQTSSLINENGGLTNTQKYVLSLYDADLKIEPTIIGVDELISNYLINKQLDLSPVSVYDVDGEPLEYKVYLIDSDGNKTEIKDGHKFTTQGQYNLEFEYQGKVGEKTTTQFGLQVSLGEAPQILIAELSQNLEQGKQYTFGSVISYLDTDSLASEVTVEISDENGKKYQLNDEINTKEFGIFKFTVKVTDAQGNSDAKELSIVVVAPEPEVTDPEVTDPEVTDPEVTDPEVTDPEVTDPEVTDPEVTDPEDPIIDTEEDIETPTDSEETDPDKETNTETGTETNTDPDKETNTETDTETEKEADTDPDKETNTETDKETGTETDTDPDKETSAETEKEASTETDKETSAETDKETNTETDKEASTESDKEASTDTTDKSDASVVDNLKEDITIVFDNAIEFVTGDSETNEDVNDETISDTAAEDAEKDEELSETGKVYSVIAVGACLIAATSLLIFRKKIK